MNRAAMHPLRRCRAAAIACAVILFACAGELARGQNEAVEVAPPTDRFADKPIAPARSTQAAGTTAPASQGPSGTRVVVSLGAVAVMIVGLGWAYRRLFAAQQQKGGGGVTLVSRAMLTPKHQVMVLRVGHRLVLVGDSGHGMNMLGEITDPAEVAAVIGDAAGGPAMASLRGQAFGAALDGAVGEYDGSLPGHESDPVERAPSDGDPHGEVRSLIERVRGLAGEMARPPETPTVTR